MNLNTNHVCKYHKINSLYKRDPKTKLIIPGEFSEEIFGFLIDTMWVIKEKIDGTNIRIIWDGEKVFIKGRTDNAQLHPKLIDRLHDLFPFEKFKELDYPQMVLYGEGVGEKIQKHPQKYLKNHSYDIVIFDIKIAVWQDMDSIISICDELGLRYVKSAVCELPYDLDTLFCRFQNDLNIKEYVPEGIVATPKYGLLDKHSNRIITKLKVDDFKNPAYCYDTQIYEL